MGPERECGIPHHAVPTVDSSLRRGVQGARFRNRRWFRDGRRLTQCWRSLQEQARIAKKNGRRGKPGKGGSKRGSAGSPTGAPPSKRGRQGPSPTLALPPFPKELKQSDFGAQGQQRITRATHGSGCLPAPVSQASRWLRSPRTLRPHRSGNGSQPSRRQPRLQPGQQRPSRRRPSRRQSPGPGPR